MEDRQSCLSGQAGLPVLHRQAGLPVFHSLQRAVGNHTIASAIRDGLAAPASPLDFALRTGMERRLGHDFSSVRVHVDAGAAARVEARAFAFGDDIVLASPQDRDTLPHELTHVAQQRGHELAIPTRLSQPHEAAERMHDAAPAREALHRTTAARVDCAPGPFVRADGTSIADPVAFITEAEDVAIAWLDHAIGEIDFTLGRVRGGAGVGWPTIGDALGEGLALVGVDANRDAVWRGSGAGTVARVLQRLRQVRALFSGTGVFYHCRGEGRARVGGCGPSGAHMCDAANAETCPGTRFTAFCDPFWAAPDLPWRARIVLHEHFHNFAAFFDHTGRAANIMCFERLVQILSNVPLQFQRTDFCADPAP
ncbi:MAG TPA: DUF4157 domain-containing protein [Thermoanaerobaculia bacterium]